MIVVEVIPYCSFQEKIKITKENDGKSRIEVFEDYIYVERREGKRMQEITCPDCGAKLIFQGGCAVCPSCGWSMCG